MCVCVYIYIHIQVCVCRYIYIYTYVHTCILTHTHTYIYIYLFISTNNYTCIREVSDRTRLMIKKNKHETLNLVNIKNMALYNCDVTIYRKIEKFKRIIKSPG